MIDGARRFKLENPTDECLSRTMFHEFVFCSYFFVFQ